MKTAETPLDPSDDPSRRRSRALAGRAAIVRAARRGSFRSPGTTAAFAAATITAACAGCTFVPLNPQARDAASSARLATMSGVTALKALAALPFAWRVVASASVASGSAGRADARTGPVRERLFDVAPGSPFGVGRRPASIVSGDLDGDGKLDLATANFGGDSVSVLLGDGRGGFVNAPGSPFPAGPKPHLLAIGDLDRDRRLDLAVTEHDSNDVRIFLGAGGGRFRPAPVPAVAALDGTKAHNHGLAIVDIDGDGMLDISTANQDDGSVSILLGDGKGAFAPAPGSPVAVGRSPYPHALGDVNGDGKTDIVAPNVQDNTVSVLLASGKGRFRPADGSPLAVVHRPYFAALADLDRDKRLDLVVSHDDTSLVTVMLGDGRGGFRKAPGSPLDAGRRGFRILLGDFDGDARVDMATGAAPADLIVLLGDGAGRFAPAPGSPYAVAAGPWALATADVNADGRLDIVVASDEMSTLSVLLAAPLRPAKS